MCARLNMDLERRLMRDMGRAIGDHRLIEEGDRIMVAMSGGKDSYGLLRAAARDAGAGAHRLRPGGGAPRPGAAGLRRRAARAVARRRRAFRYKILRENTYAIVTDKIPEGKTYCSLCSRLRRGILYRVAGELGCNKIALGHHRDDALETLLLNLFFGGKLASMPPRLAERRRPLRRHPTARLRGGGRPGGARRGARLPDPPVHAVRLAGRARSASR